MTPSVSKDAAQSRPRVLVVADYYLPGVNAGGPVRSVANMVDRLADEIDFFILTRNHDLGSQAPYEQLGSEYWHAVGRAKVKYFSAHALRRVLRHVAEVPHETLYLPSYFSRLSLRLLWARRLGAPPRRRVVVAPRGQFAFEAMSLKPNRKRAMLSLSNAAGIHSGIIWHATTAAEAGQISSAVKSEEAIVAANLSSTVHGGSRSGKKSPGQLRIVAIARIHRIKNILQGIQWLQGLEGDVRYDIIGPHEDNVYLEECRRAAAQLPRNVKVNFLGPLPHDEIAGRMGHYDLFFLPTTAESYGHSISEALGGGVPVLVSDRTPWRGLTNRGAGWDVPLQDPARFREILQHCVAMPAEAHAAMSAAAKAVALDASRSSAAETLAAYRRMLVGDAGAPR